MLSNHLILCHPLLLLPSIFPSIRVFFNEPALRIRWAKYWSFNFRISPSHEYSGLISYRIDWFDLKALNCLLTMPIIILTFTYVSYSMPDSCSLTGLLYRHLIIMHCWKNKLHYQRSDTSATPANSTRDFRAETWLLLHFYFPNLVSISLFPNLEPQEEENWWKFSSHLAKMTKSLLKAPSCALSWATSSR